jgi:alkaline phosphatase isozyme conversion protein
MKPSMKFVQLALICVLLLAACQGQPAPQPTATATLEPSPTPEVHGKLALKHLLALAQEIGARSPGSPQETAAAKYIQTTFENLGYGTKAQTFSFEDEEEDQYGSRNVVAVKPGLSDQTLIVGAHYDSGDEAKGVDDNASGVAVMLEAAELLSKVETPYTIIFVAFGAEENDLDGSYYYVERMSSSEIKNTVAMINLDSLAVGDLAYVYGDAGPGTLRDWILKMAPEAGFKLEGKTAADLDNEDGSPCECSDYDPFQKAKIPFVYFEATDWNLGKKDGMTQVDPRLGDEGEIRHTKYDTIDSINQLFPGRIEEKLNLFVTLLTNTLTDFKLP